MRLTANKALDLPKFKRFVPPKYQTVDERLGNWAMQFKKKVFQFIACPECGKTILNDNNMLQNHMKEVHVKDRLVKKEKMHRFHLTTKPTFSDTAYNIANNKDSRNKIWNQ